MSPMLCRSGNALVSEDGGGRKEGRRTCRISDATLLLYSVLCCICLKKVSLLSLAHGRQLAE